MPIHEFKGQRVSVRGRFGERSEFDKLPPFNVEQIASHDAIAERAHELHQREPYASDVENWLTAETRLLQENVVTTAN